ncbi:hypothetical protein JCM8547_003822 [Rhodosporidiobolus lusitaniae]
MDLPLPNETLSAIFAYISDDFPTLLSLCFSSKGLAHVARPFLYSSLPLPFSFIRKSGLVLDPGAYARCKAVTEDGEGANVSLRRAVRTVVMNCDGKRAARGSYPSRLQWTPKLLLETLLKTCDNLHELRVEDPNGQQVLQSLGTLPSSISRLSTLFLSCDFDLASLPTLTSNLVSILPQFEFTVTKSYQAPNLLSFSAVRTISFHLDKAVSRSYWQVPRKINLCWNAPPNLEVVELFAASSGRWWTPRVSSLLGDIPALCKQKGWTLKVNGKVWAL